tara:strand:+ start:316 stop:624 length:309 start_codon:yes stop_codon:yes gene_type:complete
MFVNKTFRMIPTIDGFRLAIRVDNGLTGKINVAIVPRSLITMQQVKAYQNGALVQDAFPTLNTSEREFIMSGMTTEDQAGYFGADPDAQPMRFEMHSCDPPR